MADFEALSTKNLGTLKTEKAIAASKAKTELKSKLAASQPGQLPKVPAFAKPAEVPWEKRPITNGQAAVFKKQADDKNQAKAEPRRVEKVRKLMRYCESFPKATKVIQKDVHAGMDERAADAALNHVYNWLGTQGARLVLKKGWVNLLRAAEFVTQDYGWNPANMQLRGIGDAAETVLREDPDQLEPEFTEAEIELGSWLVKPWYVRIVAKTFDFMNEYSTRQKQETAKAILKQRAAATSNIPSPFQ